MNSCIFSLLVLSPSLFYLVSAVLSYWRLFIWRQMWFYVLLRGTKNVALWNANVRLIKWHLGNLCNDMLLVTWRLWQFESRQFYCEPAWFLQWVAGNYFRQSILDFFFRELIISLALLLSSSLAKQEGNCIPDQTLGIKKKLNCFVPV